MASLLSWGKKAVHNIGHEIQQDIVRPVQGAVAQLNPVDGNRTYKTVTQKGASYAPQPNQSALHQLTHSGASNFVGDIAKPLIQFPIDTSSQIYNHVVAPTLKLPGVWAGLSPFTPGTFAKPP